MTIGDKVVCVDDSPSKHGHKCPVVDGRVYVVSQLFEHKGKLGLNLIGVRIKNKRYCGFAASRFRLLSEMKREAKKDVGLLVVLVQLQQELSDKLIT